MFQVGHHPVGKLHQQCHCGLYCHQGGVGKATCRAEMCLSWLAVSAACAELDAAASCSAQNELLHLAAYLVS